MKHIDDINGPNGEASVYECDTDIVASLIDIAWQYAVYLNGEFDGQYRTLHEARSRAHRLVGNG